MDEASDEELMAQIGRGDEAAFRLISRRYAGRAIGLARRVTGSNVDCDDIAQEALLRVWINAPRWRPSAAFRTWFYRVVLNLCLNRRRRRPFVALEQAVDPPDPSADAAASLNAPKPTAKWRPPSRPCPSVSAPRSCSPIMRGSAMLKPPRYSKPRSLASKRCWCERGARCAKG